MNDRTAVPAGGGDRAPIYFVTTFTHRYTHRAVEAARADFRRVSYPALLARRYLPRGTYIFADFDRLGFWQLELAAHAYRALRDAGCPVINDPARALQRLALLRALHREGVNSFNAWAAGEAETVDRFPVFLRTAAAHRGNLTGLIADHNELAAELERLIGQGFPRADLIAIEYRAEPIAGDVFRKMSAYRIGDALVPTTSVHERNWTAKYGEEGAAGETGYAEDLRLLTENPYRETLQRAFRIAEIDYGRVDFGIVGGRPEIYEINTNPMITLPAGHAAPDRAEAIRISRERYHAALDALPRVLRGSAVRIPRPPPLARQPRIKRLFAGYRWLP